MDIPMVVQHLVNLPRIHGRAMLRDTSAFEIRAFFRAFRQLPEALRKRFEHASHSLVSDREVLARSQKS